jgi:DNA-binding NtrC family response regulator
MEDAVLRKRTVVLIVEDEPLILMNAVDIVVDADFEAVEATNADEAIGILATRDDVRVVFTDMDMPGSMDGLKLACSVRRRWPPVQFIVASGHVKVAQRDLPHGSYFFAKPYLPSQITTALREIYARDRVLKPTA